MRRRALTSLLWLYPRAWRDRYGAEVRDLTEELLEAGELTVPDGYVGLTAGALVAHGQAFRQSRRAPFVIVSVALIFVASMTAFSAINRSSSTYDLTVIGPMGHAHSLEAGTCRPIRVGRAASSDTLMITARGRMPRAIVVVQGTTMSCTHVVWGPTVSGRGLGSSTERITFETTSA